MADKMRNHQGKAGEKFAGFTLLDDRVDKLQNTRPFALYEDHYK